MKILIITTYYPPDTAIAAVRPYMFAKYLKQYGHEITVLRSGLLWRDADPTFLGSDGIRVISYLGENSIAERIERGEFVNVQNNVCFRNSRFTFLPKRVRNFLISIYEIIRAPYVFYRWMFKENMQMHVKPLKAAVDKLSTEHFDAIFSTYGGLANVIGGRYAARVLKAKWIQDFRDPIEPHSPNAFGVPFLRHIQKNSVRQADICTAVSDDLADYLSCQVGGKKVYTLYNGYEPIGTVEDALETVKGQLSFCYTGTIYEGKQSFDAFLKVLRKLIDEGRISKDKVCIHYAGKDFSCLQKEADAYCLSNILVDHGYVDRTEALRIQNLSDVFLVLSWNTKCEKGVLTGKLYEGIRAKKPILSIVAGDVPHSELDMINKKYQYGFCYESAREKEQFPQLCNYLEGLYREKMSAGSIFYVPNPALKTDFRYDTLAKKLEEFCLMLNNCDA